MALGKEVTPESSLGTVAHIFIAADRGAPMRSVRSAFATPGAGLGGDRYAERRHRKGQDRDITLIEMENILAFREATGLELEPDGPRRNVVTIGVRLNDLCGLQFRIGHVIVEALELCEPCKLFQKRTHPQALSFFAGRGGLRGRVLEAGQIQVGDALRR